MPVQGQFGFAPKITEDACDTGLEEVFAALRKRRHLEVTAAAAVREALDDVINSDRTGRWSVEQLEKTEKTYIGTRVEIILRDKLELSKGQKLDTCISGQDVDIKFSLSKSWMIPSEAVDKICLVVDADELRGRYSLGLIRATKGNLCAGANKDGKRALSAEGKKRIKWLVENARLEPNALAELDENTRAAVLLPQKGQPRINELFRRMKNRRVPRRLITALARQDDPMKRVRDAKKHLKKEGIIVVCGRYSDERKEAEHRGFTLGKTECISFDA